MGYAAKAKTLNKTGTRMRWTDHELALIKTTFAEQEELLVLVRKFLLQGDLTKSELSYLKSFTQSPEVLAIIKKAVNPQLDKQAAPFQSVDLFSSMDFNPTPAEHAYLIIKSRHVACKYLDIQFAVLEGSVAGNTIEFDKLVEPTDDFEQTYINMIARNFLLSHIDSQLFNSLAIIAGSKDESPEEQKRRLTMDSSK